MKKLDSKRIKNIMALTPLQEGMLFHYIQDAQSQLYFEQLSLSISGEIDFKLFEKAWNVVCETNEMLRTVFRWEKLEKPSQIILKEQTCRVNFYDLSEKDANQKQTALEEIKMKDRHEAFDLRLVPFRIILTKLAEKQYEMIISNHHILYDGWSNGIILKEFFQAYHQLSLGGEEVKLPTKPPFKEFVQWIQSQDTTKQQKYWSNYLADIETQTELPIKTKIERSERSEAEDFTIILGNDLKGKLDVFVKNNRITLASVFYTAWGVLLQKYCGSEDVIFGTTVSGRSAGIKGIEDMVGLFINTIPLRIQVIPNEKIGDMVFKTDLMLREREAFENTSLVDIRSYIGTSNPLFDTMIAIENYPLDNHLVPEGCPLLIHSYAMMETTHYDLSVGIVLLNENEIEINFSSQQKLFEKKTIENLAWHFKCIIQNLIETPEKTLSHLEIISSEEKNRILYEFNNTEMEYPWYKTIHQLFEEQALRTPDCIALVGADLRVCPESILPVRLVPLVRPVRTVSLSYRQLNDQSNQLAGLLIEKGVLADNIVAIMMERSIEMVMGIFGILKSGGAYLPIDSKYPQERIDYMLKDSKAEILIDLNSLKECPYQRLQHSASVIQRILHSNLAYVIYTSGSTGKPKGVLIEHASVVNRMFWVKDRYELNERDVILQAASFVFDVSVCELFRWIPVGAKLCLLPPRGEMDPGVIVETIAQYGATTADFVPSIVNLILDLVDKSQSYNALSSLRWMFTGVETVSLNLVKRFLETLGRFNNTKLINAYGPTESTVDVTYFQCEEDVEDYGMVPIGKPMANVQIYIIDRYGNLQPPGIGGELCIGGKGLARGYLNNPELTWEKFNFNRYYRSHRTYSNFYKTGDLGRWLPGGPPAGGATKGIIEFLGRVDYQVKIRGFRIELGEIENRILNYPGIKEVVVLAREEVRGDKYLCAYVVSEVENGILGLRELLAKDLPEYMIPAYFVRLEKIPLTPSGKVDRKALPKPEINVDDRYMGPRDEVEKKLVEIWSDILGRDALHSSQLLTSIGINDNFFRLGGHSLKATILVSKIHKVFDVLVPVAEIFKTPRIAELAKYIKAKGKESHISIAPVEEKEYYDLSPAQKRLYILQQMVMNNTGYNMPYIIPIAENIEVSKLESVFKKLIERHESLRTSFITVNEKPVQRIYRKVEFAIGCCNVPEEVKPEALIADFTKPFNLGEAPLMKANVILMGSSKRVLFIDMHHIIMDWTSQVILEKEFWALLKGETLQPQDLPFQYKDYSEWYNGRLRQEVITQQESYWLKEFSDELPVLDLPTDFPRPAVQSIEGNIVNFSFNVHETGILKSLVNENGITLFMVLLSVYNILLSKLSGQEDIIIGTPIAARRHVDLANVIGMLVNTLALRNFPTGDKTLKEFLQEVRVRTLEAYENQEYPFEVLVDKIAVNRDAGRNPIFDVLLNLLNQDDYRGENPAEGDQPVYHHIKRTSRFDMAFSAVDMDDKIYITLEYSTRLYTPGTIERFISYLKQIIISLPGNSDKKLSEMDYIPAGEKEKILDLSPGIDKIIDKSGLNIHRVFEEKVRECPDKIALVFEGSHLSYGELNRRANQLAGFLREKGISADEVVGLMISRSLEMVIAILAILKAGGAYMPIDPDYPPQRILTMLNESQVSLLLTEGKLLDRFAITALKDMKTSKFGADLTITPSRGQIKDFDRIPIPNRTLIDYKKYHQYIGEAPVKHSITLQATRGCPFNCSFCHKIWPKVHVARSAENIFKEISYAYEGGVRRFVFIDDIFNLDQKNAACFLETVIKSKMEIQLFFPNGFRADILSKEFIDLMVAAGTFNLDVALESASPRIQKLIRKNLNLDKFKENIQYIAEKYPQVILEVEMMHGFPTETEDEAMMTLDFLKEIKWVHFPNLHILKIFPNTDMYRLAIENGISDKLIQRSTQLAFHELPETLPFPKSFTQQFQARFMGEYFLSRERLLHVLPQQMKTLSEDELVQKYDSYLSFEIKSFNDILKYAGISRGELGDIPLKQDQYEAPQFIERIRPYFPGYISADDAFRVLLLDLSQLFTEAHEQQLHHQVEEPLGLMYLATYLEDRFKERIHTKICKSRIDFDSHEELKRIILEFRPHLIGIRTLSFYKEFFHRTVMMIRRWETNAPIVTGGPYATSDFQLILQDRNVDLVVLGEGELTLGELVEKMMGNKGKLPGEDVLAGIHGIVFAKKETRQRGREIAVIDEIFPVCSHYDHHNLPREDSSSNLLYVIYTSGSTGTPKGVMLEHRHLMNLIRCQYNYTPIDFHRVLQFTTLGFDVSAQEIFSTLLAGGSLILINKETQGDIPRLLEVLGHEQVETLFLPASFLKYIMNEEDFIKHIPGCIKHIVTAGEQVIINEKFRKYLIENSVYFHNHYGPAETHVVTAATFQPGVGIPDLPHIGRPIMNTQIYILDRVLNLVPIGVPGQLVIGGSQVGRGYMNNPDLTAEKFIFNRSYRSYETYIFYKTGDLARWLPDGNIEFLGRIDNQVKVRGFRVELGEIEKRLLNHPGIKEAVVLVQEERGDKYICAYIVPNNELVISELREYLPKELPDYMIPSHFVMLEKIPLSPNRKIDRKALPKPEPEVGENYKAPRDEIEKKLIGLWSSILGGEDLHASQLQASIGIDDNFFELGGHSLKATILASRIEKTFNIKIPLSEIFKNPRIRELSSYIKKEAPHKYEQIELVEQKEYYILSSAQKRMYFLQQIDKDGTTYNISSSLILEGSVDNVDKKKMGQAIREVIGRHESLRTAFEVIAEEPVQRIHGHVAFEIEYKNYNLSTDYTDDTDEKDNTFHHSFIRAFDLSKAPLLRVGLTKLEEEKYLFLVDMHHIISDGMSIQVLIQDFSTFYNGNELPEIKVQYKDYAEWQNRERMDKKILEQGAYWRKEYEGEIPVLELPVNYARPAIQSFEGQSKRFEINVETFSILKALALETGTTLYLILLASYYVFLAKISNQEDIVIGTPVAGRRHADLEKVIGLFVNTLALRNYPSGQKKFIDFLEEVKKKTLEALENQDYPYEDLVEEMDVIRDTSRNPLFDTLFVLQNTGRQTIEIPGLSVKPYEHENLTSKFDLSLIAVEAEKELLFTFEYSTKLFKEETIERFIVYFLNIVSRVSNDKYSGISSLEIITEAEKRLILCDFNDTSTDYPKDKTIHQLFEEQVSRTPDYIALVGADLRVCPESILPVRLVPLVPPVRSVSLSYRELNERSNCLANVLIEKGVLADNIIGIKIERCLEMIIGIMGILKSGGAYLPIDPDYPKERVDYMLKDSGARLLAVANGLEGEKVRRWEGEKNSSNLAYVIYTSGSTGKPKGVLTTHANVTRVVKDTNYIKIEPADRLLQISNYAFDGSVFDIYGALLNGAELVMIDKNDILSVERLSMVIKREGITVFFVTTALFNTLIEIGMDYLNGMRKILFGGERVSLAHSRKALEYLGKGRIVHVYGPTETTVYATYYFINSIDAESVNIPIGKPISNTTIYILDNYLNPVPIGVNGEIYIGGAGVARGYLNNPELTAEKFIFNRSYRTHRTYINFYKTGDLARWWQDGNIEFLGRNDQQVKIRGFRIEPGEIENQLLKHQDIKEAVLVVKENGRGVNSLTAYFVANKELLEIELREYLSKELPDYMIPVYFVPLEKIPLTPNGKVDRKALPKPQLKTGDRYTPPRDEIEKKLAELWSEILGKDETHVSQLQTSIGIDGNFFHLGGHSLKAALLAARIHKKFNINIPLVEIFRTPVLKDLAQYIKKKADPHQYISIEPAEEKEYYVLSSAQKRLYVIQQMDPDSTVYNIPAMMSLIGELDRITFEETFKKIIQRHESLRTSFHMLHEEPVQKIHENITFEIEYYDMQADSQFNAASINEIVKGFIRPFNLETAPLLRVSLIKENDQKHILLIDMNHIISDGTSIGILENEFMALIAGKDPGTLKIQYRDWTQWQYNERNSERVRNQEAYWMHEFESKIPVLNLPCDYTRSAVQDFTGQRITFSLSIHETECLNRLARQEEVTLYMLLLSAYYVLLYKLTDQEDIIIGAPTAGRFQEELQKIIGMFLNTLALRNFPAGNKPFKQFLKEVKGKVLNAFENQDYQFDDLVDRLGVKRGEGRNPLFDVMFILQNMGKPEIHIPGLELKSLELEYTNTKFDFSLYAEEEGRELIFSVTYSEKLFTRATIALILDYFKTILSSIIQNPSQALTDINVIPAEKRNEILTQFNQDLETEASPIMGNGIFQTRLQQSLLKFKDNIAVEYGDISVSYAELDRRSNVICFWILNKGIPANTFIGMLINNKLQLIVILLGIIKAGCVIVPLYPGYPVERLENMIQVTDLKYIFIDIDNTRRIKQNQDVEFIDPSQFDFVSKKEKESDANQIKVFYNPGDPLYIHFTSGSTGEPKATLGKNKGLLHFICWEIETLGISPDFHAAQFTIPGFDPFLRDVFAPLLAGGVVCIPGHENIVHHAVQLAYYIEQRRISLIHCVTGLFRLIMSSNPSSSYFKNLKYILLAGEKTNPSDLVEWYETFADRVQLLNCYGPTETTMSKAYYLITPQDIKRERIPVGKPLPGARIIILDENRNLCAPLTPGEICIRTPFGSCGYFNAPGLNREKFISNPFRVDRNDPGDLIYRSGDLGRILADGNIDILGRTDRQVKIRGYRVEPGDIEHHLLKHPEIKDALVLPLGDENKDSYLCAYIIPRQPLHVPKLSELREYLAQKLPDYMIPAYFVQMERFPLTARGKIDRNQLPEPGIEMEENVVTPINDTEKRLLKIWSEVLHKDENKISVLANFFEIGGHSLKAAALVAKIHKEFNVNIPLAELFKTMTIRGLSQYIRETAKEQFLDIKPTEKKWFYLLSSAQKRLYFLQKMEESSSAYNIPRMMKLEGRIDIDKLADVFSRLIQRHESLRTSFHMVEEDPVQRIHEHIAFEIEYKDLATDKHGQTRTFLMEFIRAFDLSIAPLLRVGLVKLAEEQHLLLVDMHHIISDGVSIQVLVQDFSALYAGKELPAIKLQYKDYADWQNRERIGKKIQEQGEYWKKEYTGEIPVLELPVDYVRPEVQGFEGSRINFELNKEISGGLQVLARESGATLYIVLLALYTILLGKLSGQEDIVVGSPVAGRRHADLEKIIGMFVNTLALRNYPVGVKEFAVFLQEVKEKAVRAFENQEYQYEDLVEEVTVTRDVSRNPLFDTMFALQNTGSQEIEIPGLKIGPYEFENRTAKFDLSLTAIESEVKLLFIFEYSTKLFKQETVERFIVYFKNIVMGIIENKNRKVSQFEIITGDEKKQILFEFNNTSKQYPQDKTIHQLFEEQASMTPGYIALVGADLRVCPEFVRPVRPVPPVQTVSLSYRELNKQANCLANVLIEKGIRADAIVGIMMERSIEMVIGIYGILKAGGAYLPIDPEYPQERIQYMLQDSKAKILIDLNSLKGCPLGGLQHSAFSIQHYSMHLAYLIYTSGSTGRPKGVMIEHRSVVNLLYMMQNQYPFRETDTYLLKTSYTFDVSVTELFGWYMGGGKLVVLEKDGHKDPQAIMEAIERDRVSHINFVPSMFSAFIDYLTGENKRRLLGLKYIFLAGEALLAELVEKFRGLNTGIILENIYGPTEGAVYSSKYSLSEWSGAGSIPIGRPLTNITLYILDKYGYLQPVGIIGELCIGGSGLARGYLNRPELTLKKFCPLITQITLIEKTKINKSFFGGSRGAVFSKRAPLVYKTGDLSRWLPDGNIEFLGRIDHQVKVRGFRIELEEIESQLLKHPEIKEAVVLSATFENGDSYLCAYIACSRDLVVSELREYLVRRLPAYMIPSEFVQLEKIPLNYSGKVDRQNLNSLGKKINTGVEHVAPKSAKEVIIAEAWKKILKLDDVGIYDNFFDLGGTSVDIIRLNTKLKETFQQDIPIVALYRYSTIASFSQFLDIDKDIENNPGVSRYKERADKMKKGMEDKNKRREIRSRRRK